MAAPAGTTRRERYEHALATCQAKQTYLSEACARNAAYLISLAHPDQPPLTAYRCRYCRDWHHATVRGES